jgi:GNAT superfamily N-acetyltransferase
MIGDDMSEIRDSRPEDFDHVFTLLQQLWAEAVPDREEMKRDFLEYIESNRDFCFCADDGEKITGFCSANIRKSMQFPGEMLYIDILIVREGYRKMGVGGKLLERAEELARELGCRAIQLDSGFQRTGAHEFYKRQGFKQLGFLFGKQI